MYDDPEEERQEVVRKLSTVRRLLKLWVGDAETKELMVGYERELADRLSRMPD
jgi:hypothetical protein